MKFIGKNLKNLRILFNLKEDEACEMLNIKNWQLDLIENHDVQPSFVQLNILKRYFNVKSMYFFQDDLISEDIKK